jgi:hypothetical protein
VNLERARAQSAGSVALLRQRLTRLAAADSRAAGQIRETVLSWAESDAENRPPSLEATAAVRQWLAEAGTPDVIIVPGAGDGPEVNALLGLLPERGSVLLLERVPSRAARLFAEAPLEEWIEQGRLALAIGADGDYAESRLLSLLDMPNAPTVRVFELTDVTDDDRAFYGELLLQVRRRIRTKVFNLGTLVQHGCRWQHNTLLNLPALLANPGVNALEGMFPGRPALVVAAGPSLNESLEFLRESARGFVILATGTALRPLRKAGIRPDLVVAVDASPKVAQQFETDCADLYLACASMACPDILGKMKGLFSGHVNANPVGLWVSTLQPPKGQILGAGTVSATALDLAVRMGCNPVLAVGLDLCMAGDGTTHARDTMYHGVRRSAESLYPVPGNYQRAVRTTNQFRVYIDAIGNFVAGHPGVRFVNINSGGAAIAGMELATGGQLAGFAAAPFDAYATIAGCHAAYDRGECAGVAAEIRRAAGDLDELSREAVNGAMLCNRLIMRLRSRGGGMDAAAAELAELNALDDRLMAAVESSLLIDMSLRAIYYDVGATPPEETDERDDRAGIRANRRSRDLYEQTAGAARLTRAQLLRVAASLETAAADGGTLEQSRQGDRDVAGKQAA